MFGITGDYIYYEGILVARLCRDKGASASNIQDTIDVLRGYDPENIYTAEQYDDHADKRYQEGFADGEAEKGLDTNRNSK